MVKIGPGKATDACHTITGIISDRLVDFESRLGNIQSSVTIFGFKRPSSADFCEPPAVHLPHSCQTGGSHAIKNVGSALHSRQDVCGIYADSHKIKRLI